MCNVICNLNPKSMSESVDLAVDRVVWGAVDRVVDEALYWAVDRAVDRVVWGAVDRVVDEALYWSVYDDVDGAVNGAVRVSPPHSNLDRFLAEVRQSRGSVQ